MLAILLIGALVANPGVSTASALQAGRLTLTAPLVDQDPESGLWAVGASWKLNVRGDGAVFYPLARDMERHQPFEIGAPRVTFGGEPTRADAGEERIEGGDLVVDRGTYRERWHLALNSVEQTFEFDAAPARGELVIDLPITTQWRYRGRDAGLLFAVEGVGDVRYGDVTTRDSAGWSVSTLSEFHGDRIRLRVPESFLANAAFPLVVDPIIENLTIQAGSAYNVFDSESAYDATTDRYLVAFATNSTNLIGDSDIIGCLLDGDGKLLVLLPLEVTVQRAYTPSVCGVNFANKFGVAYQNVGLTGVNSIRVRFLTAATGLMDTQFTVQTASHCHSPKLAGSSHSGFPQALLAYARGSSSSKSKELCVGLVSTSGPIGELTVIDTEGLLGDFEVTASDGPFKRWGLIWVDELNNPPADLLYARMFDSVSGAPFAAPVSSFSVATSPDQFGKISIAGDGQNFACLFQRVTALDSSTSRVLYRELKYSAGNLVGSGSTFDFTAIDDQIGPAIRFEPRLALDGARYVYSGDPSGLQGVIAGTISPVGAGFELLEQDIVVSDDGNALQGDITTKFEFGGPVGEALLTCQPRGPNLDYDLAGISYQPTLSPGGVTVSQTGCGGVGVEPQISFAGQLSIAGGAGTINLTSQPFGSPQIWVGTPLAHQLCTACPFGVVASNIVPGNSLTIVNGTSPALLGTQIAIQGVVMNPLLGTKCTNLAGQTFQTSDTLLITLQ
jgi:hypothetical protein